jgi:hypothetical protein
MTILLFVTNQPVCPRGQELISRLQSGCRLPGNSPFVGHSMSAFGSVGKRAKIGSAPDQFDRTQKQGAYDNLSKCGVKACQDRGTVSLRRDKADYLPAAVLTESNAARRKIWP